MARRLLLYCCENWAARDEASECWETASLADDSLRRVRESSRVEAFALAGLEGNESEHALPEYQKKGASDPEESATTTQTHPFYKRLSHPLAPPEAPAEGAAKSESCLFCACICAIVNLGPVAAAPAAGLVDEAPPKSPKRSEKSDAALGAGAAAGVAGFTAEKEEVWGWSTGREG